MDATTVARALRGGVATLDALSERLGGADREELLWALDDARARGWVTADIDECGICSASAPTLYAATEAGRAAAA